MVPLWLTLFDGLRPGGQPWTLRVWVGTLVGFAGVALVVRPEGSVEAGHWLGMAALVIACIMWSFGSLYAQAIRERTPVLTAAAIEMLAASVFLALASLAFGEDLGRLASASASAWAAVLYLVAFGSLLAFTAFAYCLNELPASTVGTYAYVNPVVAVALGYLILDEPVSAGLLGGAALILIGVVVTTTARPKPTRLDAPDGDEHGAPPPESERQAA
jgi:drug/metabolite transporter (DMT)-like permease